MIDEQPPYPDFTLTINTDLDGLKMITAYRDMFSALIDAKNFVRAQLKYQSLTQNEEKILEELKDILYVPAMESIS